MGDASQEAVLAVFRQLCYEQDCRRDGSAWTAGVVVH